ncbi:ATP-binding cassette domain-containing protein [Nonomuraea dietziae]|uniref:ATP-binding cassette domain-containing protein n=1 Tax=Nonomuraea dietziae TaxID=65515 RepID=UPI0031D85C49
MTPLLEAEGLVKRFPMRHPLTRRVTGHLTAVDGVSLTVRRGETLGLVGESGCGKSSTARLITRLAEPTGGTIRFDGRDITTMGEATLRPVRRDLQMIFQDPFSSLNPRMTVEAILSAPFRYQGLKPEPGQIAELLRRVGLRPEHAERLPHQFSGGQAPADRHRPRAGPSPEAGRLRRAGVRTRRLRTGADPQPAARPAGGVRAQLRVHRPRPRRRAPGVRQDRGDVPRHGRGDRRP